MGEISGERTVSDFESVKMFRLYQIPDVTLEVKV